MLAMKYIGLLNKYADPGGTNLVDACNGFNEMLQLAMLWTVCHRWTAGERFALSCYRHWAKLLLYKPMD